MAQDVFKMDLKKLLANDEITALEKVIRWNTQTTYPHQEEQNPDSYSWIPTIDCSQQGDSTQQGDIDEMPPSSSAEPSQGERSESRRGGPRELLQQYKASSIQIICKLDADNDTPNSVKELLDILPLYKRSGVAVIPGSLEVCYRFWGTIALDLYIICSGSLRK